MNVLFISLSRISLTGRKFLEEGARVSFRYRSVTSPLLGGLGSKVGERNLEIKLRSVEDKCSTTTPIS